MTPVLIVNENFPAPAVKLLRLEGFDVLSVQETMPGASDQHVLAVAHESGRWLVTFDRDYGELVFSQGSAAPPAILYLRQQRVTPMWAAERVRELLAISNELMGHLVVVTDQSVRLRRLPEVLP